MSHDSNVSAASAPALRLSLIGMLCELKMNAADIDVQLAAKGYAPLTASEKDLIWLAPVAPAKVAVAKTVAKTVKPDAKAAKAVADVLLYKLVEVARAAKGEAWYAEYRTIKYPGGVESLATDATRTAAYQFAFNAVLGIKLA